MDFAFHPASEIRNDFDEIQGWSGYRRMVLSNGTDSFAIEVSGGHPYPGVSEIQTQGQELAAGTFGWFNVGEGGFHDLAAKSSPELQVIVSILDGAISEDAATKVALVAPEMADHDLARLLAITADVNELFTVPPGTFHGRDYWIASFGGGSAVCTLKPARR